jgi:hypothetical protein
MATTTTNAGITPAYNATNDDVVLTSGYAPKRVSWAAIFAGAVVTLAVQLLLAMLGAGIGASTLDPLRTDDGSPSGSAFGMGAAIWWIVSSLIALFSGGWVAGRLSGAPRATEGGMHGILTWALSLLVLIYIVSTATSAVVRGAAGVLGTAANVAATGAAAAAPAVGDAAKEGLKATGLSWDDIKREAQTLLSQTGKPDLQPGKVAEQAKGAIESGKKAASSEAPEENIGALLDRLLSQGKDAASQVDRDAVINVVVARTGVSREEAAKRVAGWEETAEKARAQANKVAEDAKQKSREVADATARNLSQAMLWGSLALFLGALAAWFGGSAGQRRVLVANTKASG